MSSPVRVGIAVVEHDGRYLVGIRRDDQPLAGCAEFPGGKCQVDESFPDCAVRECLEETGLKVTAERLLLQTSHRYAHADVDLAFWLCRVAAGAAAEARHGFRWVDRDDLFGLPFPEANAALLDVLRNGA